MNRYQTMNISEKIRLLRAEMGWSQKELAEKEGISEEQSEQMLFTTVIYESNGCTSKEEG